MSNTNRVTPVYKIEISKRPESLDGRLPAMPGWRVFVMRELRDGTWAVSATSPFFPAWASDVAREKSVAARDAWIITQRDLFAIPE